MNQWIVDMIDFWKLILVDINNWYGFIGAIILLLIISITFIRFKKQINRKSILEINKNNGKKYFRDLYVEIGDTHDLLRYFINGDKWFKRLRSNLYKFLNNYVGQLFKNYSGITIRKYSRKRIIYKHLSEIQEKIEKIDKEAKIGENNLLFLHTNAYNYKYELPELVATGNLIKKRVCFVLGEAGCGKTNLMTRVSKVIIEKYKEHCIYINAKTITDNNIEKKFNEYFYTKIFINDHSINRIKVYLTLLSLTSEKIFVIFEAVNENENPNFIMELVNFINKYSEYKKIYFIITARSEFFKIKYEQIITDCLTVDYEIISINNREFNGLALDRMMVKYREHYEFHGQISDALSSTLKRSPIMMRMFFECFEKSNQDINEMTGFQLFNYYIEKLRVKYHTIDLWGLLYDIAKCMIDENRYDYVLINNLCNIDGTSDTLVYENVLLDQSIIVNENSLDQESQSVITFTYDEMRDFILSKYLIKIYNSGEMDLVKYLDSCKATNSNILEGILKYLYLQFKMDNNYELAKLILNEYANGTIIYLGYQEEGFMDLGLKIIFLQNQDIEDFEIEYISNSHFSSRDIQYIIKTLIKNTLHGLNPNTSIFLQEINRCIFDTRYKSNLLNLDREYYRLLLRAINELNTKDQEKLNDIKIGIQKWLER